MDWNDPEELEAERIRLEQDDDTDRHIEYDDRENGEYDAHD